MKKRKSNNGFDFEKEIQAELSKKGEIDSRRKKRKWIFWSLVVGGVLVVSAFIILILLERGI